MKLLTQIIEGTYSRSRAPDDYNGFGQRHRGADVYEFGNGVALHTYPGTSWHVTVDGVSLPMPEGLSDDTITAAFETARAAKLRRALT